jgi:hypothetical protein
VRLIARRTRVQASRQGKIVVARLSRRERLGERGEANVAFLEMGNFWNRRAKEGVFKRVNRN